MVAGPRLVKTVGQDRSSGPLGEEGVDQVVQGSGEVRGVGRGEGLEPGGAQQQDEDLVGPAACSCLRPS
ncbi:hypothetical protein ASD62_09100 [Phycicoccus sp. Root563]|nr:hypothetical protein ASD62_09100 [Phycicoccus sp. Root563]